MKIFWSWQSDTPGKTGRHLIRDALAEAIEELRGIPDIEEPTTEATREALHLDHDIQGEIGTPDLAPTIFAKIERSAVVIADVTLVGSSLERSDKNGSRVRGKKLINSNVAIELGYALRALTDKHVLLVFNSHYGRHEELPFDLRHKGGAIVFSLAEDASRPQIEAAKRSLKDYFVKRLEPYVKMHAIASKPPTQEAPSTFNSAAYFKKGEVLAQVGVPDENQVHFVYETENLCYLRLIPSKRSTRPLTLPELRKLAGSAPILHQLHSSLIAINAYGAISYDPANHPREGTAKLNGSTQLFENGEIWCLTSKLLVQERADRPAWVKIPFIPSLYLEQTYYDTLRSMVRFAETKLSTPAPWTIEAGVTGLDGAYIAVSQDAQWGPIRKAEVVYRATIKNAGSEELETFLLAFYSRLFDATGYARPTGLHGFPPNPPH